MGAVAGDAHDIGKNIVGAMLIAAGFDVYNIGKGMPAAEFVEKSTASKCKRSWSLGTAQHIAA